MWYALSWSPAYWWARYLAGLASASARVLNEGGRSPLLRLHIETLRLRDDGGARPPYAMRLPRLRLIKRD